MLPGGICRCSYPVSGWLNQWNEALDYLEGIRCLIFMGSLSIVGVGFVKIPPQFYEKGSFYV